MTDLPAPAALATGAPRKLTRKAFVAWLKKQPTDALRDPRSPYSCWLAAFTGLSVCPIDIGYPGQPGYQLCPKWAEKFQIDSFANAHDAGVYPLTAARALEILRAIR